jgi:MFS family permease
MGNAILMRACAFLIRVFCRYLERRGWSNAYAQAASLGNMAFSLGSAIGPVVASSLVEARGTFFAFCVLGAAGLLMAPFAWAGRWALTRAPLVSFDAAPRADESP